jgi:hypothetical protein
MIIDGIRIIPTSHSSPSPVMHVMCESVLKAEAARQSSAAITGFDAACQCTECSQRSEINGLRASAVAYSIILFNVIVIKKSLY